MIHSKSRKFFLSNWAIFNGHHLLQNRRHRCKDRWRFDLLPISPTTFAKAAPTNIIPSMIPSDRHGGGVAHYRRKILATIDYFDRMIQEMPVIPFFIQVSKFYFNFFPKGINFLDNHGERFFVNFIEYNLFFYYEIFCNFFTEDSTRLWKCHKTRLNRCLIHTLMIIGF